ncbi:survival of motor neuron-related-splicing factor 30-like [Watersipora subatra]|uniref:survival of motor neuron-related-splicing factor 30-like n=1 Tax=Watersipora subatra TaxID=2589382 RepID=UPI00355B8229
MAASKDHLKNNLVTYTEQLTQVEAALSVDPENDQLVKLKADLQEVIELTEELMKQSAPAASDSAADTDETKASHSAVTAPVAWNSGDKCMATWSNDGQFYPCVIDEILEDGTCSVNFEGYNQSEVTQVSSLLPYDPARAKETRNRRDKAAAEREYKKAKNLKKKQRLKELEEQREKDKNKWQTFNSKLFSKTTKGRPSKKSIFATSEHVKGKVGVGTCGISGKPMTDQHSVPKYHKGML